MPSSLIFLCVKIHFIHLLNLNNFLCLVCTFTLHANCIRVYFQADNDLYFHEAPKQRRHIHTTNNRCKRAPRKKKKLSQKFAIYYIFIPVSELDTKITPHFTRLQCRETVYSCLCQSQY